MCVISDSELISWFVIKYRFFLYCIRQSKKLLKNLNAMTELIKCLLFILQIFYMWNHFNISNINIKINANEKHSILVVLNLVSVRLKYQTNNP